MPVLGSILLCFRDAYHIFVFLNSEVLVLPVYFPYSVYKYRKIWGLECTTSWHLIVVFCKSPGPHLGLLFLSLNSILLTPALATLTLLFEFNNHLMILWGSCQIFPHFCKVFLVSSQESFTKVVQPVIVESEHFLPSHLQSQLLISRNSFSLVLSLMKKTTCVPHSFTFLSKPSNLQRIFQGPFWICYSFPHGSHRKE